MQWLRVGASGAVGGCKRSPGTEGGGLKLARCTELAHLHYFEAQAPSTPFSISFLDGAPEPSSLSPLPSLFIAMSLLRAPMGQMRRPAKGRGSWAATRLHSSQRRSMHHPRHPLHADCPACAGAGCMSIACPARHGAGRGEPQQCPGSAGDGQGRLWAGDSVPRHWQLFRLEQNE